ncbi:ATP-binding cassette domain-containing protein [Dysgonomonas mossii]|uniref:ATP-binding cassette domain-containing protein n=1 Tax=Dysgonomonas mossii TaxID=163665 RepID=A0A4Y9IKQ3_9BACT|nr:ATP-binding cassette domain-containing protein [Dysgonomonas mossii]MBF0762036.1 ATP-binding cassette domain-containing protein [Dysgonomonas mossii]TFU88856.1 ATP-binding cassette domain-containing protein [Dysgonomonas mossii]
MKEQKLETILEVKNLKKVYFKEDGETLIAVNGISFDLIKGEIFSFLGPNGAGKSTTINMLTAQLTPTSGEIIFQGQSLKDNPIFAKSKVGVVAQHNNLDRGLTARENLIYHGRYFGMSESEAVNRADELLESFGLTDWKNDYVKSFSGGMAQRLKIARAIMHQPEILFLDEPTTGLDPAYREVLWKQVLKLNKDFNTTVFLTTHYMEEPERFSDRVAIYNKGVIKAIGTVQELRELVPSQTIISITLDNVTEEIVDEVKKLPDVISLSLKDEKNFIVYAENSRNVLNELLVWIENKHLSLESINLSATTLDDMFIYLTTNDLKIN